MPRLQPRFQPDDGVDREHLLAEARIRGTGVEGAVDDLFVEIADVRDAEEGACAKAVADRYYGVR